VISTRYDTMLDSWVSISPLSVSHPVRRVCLHWQLPAIGGYGTLLSAALDDEARAGGRRTARNLSSGQQRRTDTIARVRALFRGVCRFDLQQQHRCDDPAHAAATASMRSLTSHIALDPSCSSVVEPATVVHGRHSGGRHVVQCPRDHRVGRYQLCTAQG
jgi:hypothetical protein